MMNRSVICTLLAALLMTAWLRADEPTLELNGRWIVTKLVIDGAELPVSTSPDSFWWEVDDDAWHYSFVLDGTRTKVTFTVTQTKNDTEIAVDAKLLNGGYAGRVCKGIYRIDGDVVRLCLADSPSIPRPTRFECPAKSGLQLFELRRAKTTTPNP
ncbi:MAG: TIGR03067 domain-containing protein [Planctomycetaceae bacterium]|nr:TIGR03067 domain-containing protein [Planctomycetales bacterium]MCB9922536.1 TIGR03067 domain-containing protein [Planctomycetaceae bacterium]